MSEIEIGIALGGRSPRGEKCTYGECVGEGEVVRQCIGGDNTESRFGASIASIYIETLRHLYLARKRKKSYCCQDCYNTSSIIQ